MQRTFVAIALALTLSCTLAVFTPINYVKAPTVVIQDGETNYTNRTNGTGFLLASVNPGELDIVAGSRTPNTATPVNTSANSWNVIYRKLDGKTLSGTANTTVNFTQPQIVSYSNGYVYSYAVESDAGTNNIPQINVYQTAVSNGNALARITLSTNTISTYTPSIVGYQSIGKNVYVFYLANNANATTPTQVNVTSFTIGSATRGSLEFNLTTSYASSLNVVWGEALGSNQLYANWKEGPSNATVLKYTAIDVTKGTYNATTANAWTNTSTCVAFSTDKKWYGDLCYYINETDTQNRPIYYSIRYANNTFLPFNSQPNVTLYANTSTMSAVYPYGPYIALLYTDTVTDTNKATTYSYELWNIDTLTTNKNKTTYLTSDSAPTFFRVVSGGLYTLSYNTNAQNATSNHYSNIQVGLVLGSSYLTSVLGFIMTVVAGVLLF